MKRLFILFLVALMGSVSVAQKGNPSRPSLHTVNFQAGHGEIFNVFIDGNLVNRLPQGRVMVCDVTDRTHEVVVVLKRPVAKAAVMQLLPNEPTIMVNVTYDEYSETLNLYTPSQNRPSSNPVADYAAKTASVSTPVSSRQEVPVPVVIKPVVSEADVAAMVLRMKNQTFDSDRLALGKVIVASSNLTAAQITRLAETIDYSSSQVEFLKYAYAYCIDKANYYTTVDILTFSNDKKSVLDYIATQK